MRNALEVPDTIKTRDSNVELKCYRALNPQDGLLCTIIHR